MQTRDKASVIRTLRGHLHRREHAAFVTVFLDGEVQVFRRNDDYLKALAGEALCLLLEAPQAAEDLLTEYEHLLLAGEISAPYSTVLGLAERLDSSALHAIARTLRDEHRRWSERRQNTNRKQLEAAKALSEPVIEVRRVVSSTLMRFGDPNASDAMGIRRSVFRSSQERAFLKALSLRFPALLALPNYPLDQMIEFSRLRELVGKSTWAYAKNSRVDAVLIVPDEGDPVAAFELDSSYHDRPEIKTRDEMKNAIFGLVGLPFYRLRAESPETMTTDDWYAFLTEEVAPNIDVGKRLRTRSTGTKFIPA